MDVVPRRICKLGGYSRDRRGCLTCRRRRKKCVVDAGETSSARCGHCNRLNLRCVWEDEKDVVPTATPFPALSPWPQRDNDEPPGRQSHRRQAMRYYVQSFAESLSTTSTNNGFLSVLLPMAMDSAPMLDAVIAWSTSHLALQQDNIHILALEDRSAALRSFASGLNSLSPETSLAICLILTSMESILGNTVDWYRHLTAAACIIRPTLVASPDGHRVVSSLESTVEGTWLLRNFAYHDVLASVSLNRSMLIPGSDWLSSGDGGTVDTYLGLGCVPVSALGRISDLVHRSRGDAPEDERATLDVEDEDASRGESTRHLMNQLSSLERELVDWKPCEFSDGPLLALAQCYRSAALICLYRLQRSHCLAHSLDMRNKIDSQVAIIVDAMMQLPAGCLPECTLLFPVFIAGGESRSAIDQEAVRARMTTILTSRSFENVRVALDVLEEVWDVHSRTTPLDPAHPYDWQNVVDRRQWELALS